MKTSVVIVAAGKSERFGKDKLTTVLGGTPILFHSINAFQSHKEINEIILVAHKERIKEFTNLQTQFSKIKYIIAGGDSRHESSRNGIQKSSGDIILVHNGANPLVTEKEISKLIQAVREHKSAGLGRKVLSTIKQVSPHPSPLPKGEGVEGIKLIEKTIPRENLYEMETPQGFTREVFEKALICHSGLDPESRQNNSSFLSSHQISSQNSHPSCSKSPHPNPLPEGEGVEKIERVKIPKYIITVARDLRQKQTPSEEILWQCLRNKQFYNLKFRRQHPFGRYIADFYCHDLKFVIELDGAIHNKKDQQEYDKIRDEIISSQGVIILRVNNEELKNIEKVFEKISNKIKTNSPLPLGEGLGVRADFTDELHFLEQAGIQSTIVEASFQNRKITTPHDLQVAENFIHNIPKIGIGHDSHKFCPHPSPLPKGEGTKLPSPSGRGAGGEGCIILGGIQIPHSQNFDANSDGDVVTHALCNAIGTAIGEGSLSKYADEMCKKGITNSLEYLKHISEKMKKQDLKIGNIAISIEGKEPKLEKHIPAMKEQLSKTLHISPLQIGIACTTGEELSSFGKGEGIQVFCNVQLVKL